VDNKFPEAMSVLVVDDNPVCLKALEVFLRYCIYKHELEYTSPPLSQSIRINGYDFHFYGYNNYDDGSEDIIEYDEG
jgi:hypothetical protein